jgi:hypothetical protein
VKAKPNWNELEACLDFASIDQKLRNLITSGKLKRKKSASDLLDKVKDALIQARANGVSFAALAAFLKENEVPVSEPTLRHYLRAQGVSKRVRRRKTNSQSAGNLPSPVAASAAFVPAKAEPQPTIATLPPPSLKIRQRGPRIADAKNL